MNSEYRNENNHLFTAKTIGEKLLNPNVNQYRLNKDQKQFYTELFYENASNGKVKKENFLPLLGIFGTQIAQDFSNRMFFVLSKGKQDITLEQYLTYIDTYHYGDINERCLYTCKLIDIKQKGIIELEDFKSYINLIINTVNKVNNTLTKKDLMSEKDIEFLFYYISQGKTYFTYKEFKNIYEEKPELVSWFDYFKNDKEDILLLINEYIPILLKIFYDLIYNFITDIFVLIDKEKEINLELIFQRVLNYSHKLEIIIDKFTKKISKLSFTNAFYNLKKQNDKSYNKNKFIFDIKNKIFKSKYKNQKQNNYIINDNIDELFKEIKKSLYKKEEKEIILENKNIKYPINKKESKNFIKKLVKNSTMFRNKNFKFFDNHLNLKDSNKSLNKKSSLSVSHSNEKRNSLNIDNNNKVLNYNMTNSINTDNNIDNISNNLNINYYNLNSNNYNYNLNSNNFQTQNLYLKDIINKNISYNYYDSPGINCQNFIYNSNCESTMEQSINFFSLKESQKLKLLLFCTRIIIEKALETNIIFNNCYRYITETYLSKQINKKKKEEKLKAKKKFLLRRNSTLNITRKFLPDKKKNISASEKSFEILFNMIMGIQIAVQAIPNFKIKDREEIKKYLTNMIYSIQTVYLGNENEETYLLKEFGGVIFNNIRLYLGISKDAFIKSISPQDFITELMISSQTIFEELCSTGSSGSLLYYTRDGEFIVKTISKSEYKFLKTILSEYYFYIKNNPLTFLPKLLGCYVLKQKKKRTTNKIFFIVMTNVFATTNHIDLRFDLKGSTIGRSVLKGTIADKKIFDSGDMGDMALKDLDFNKLNETINVGVKREQILNQFQKDIEFLYNINSNDYSLLLGIHYINNNKDDNITKKDLNEDKKDDLSSLLTDNTSDVLLSYDYETESNISSENSAVERINKLKGIYDFEDGGILSDDKKKIYYLGIIDILTEFTSIKKIEYVLKTLRYCSNKMSCVPPFYYKQRFYNYLHIIFSEQSQNNQEKKNNDNNIINGIINQVDKFGSIGSTNYRQYQRESGEKYTIEDSLQKL